MWQINVMYVVAFLSATLIVLLIDDEFNKNF